MESPYDTAVTSCTGQDAQQATCPSRQICSMSHFTRSASWPLTSPNPGFWGQCQVPEDYVKCAHVSSQRGVAFPTFWGQCQNLLGININMQICVAAVAPEELQFFDQYSRKFSSFEEFLMHPSWGSIFFRESVTNLGQSIFFRCNCITQNMGCHQGGKNGSKAQHIISLLVRPKSFLGGTDLSTDLGWLDNGHLLN